MNENKLSRQIEEYISYKQALGFNLTIDAKSLRKFAEYTKTIDYTDSFNTEIALSWASLNSNSNKTIGRRLEILSPFAKYVCAFDTEAKPLIIPYAKSSIHSRPVPYIYSENEVLALMNECNNLFSPDGIRAYTVATIIGLLWSTGMRPAEPIKLCVKDIDLEKNTIFIRNTKFSKERIIPIDSSVTQKLKEYKLWITNKIGPRNSEDAFFYTTDGNPMDSSALYYAFKLIRPCINAHPIGYKYVRLYDFRHTMVCNTIKRWSQQGLDINSMLYTLSQYMGHVKPEETYWYLSSTPEIMELSCKKYESWFGGSDL